MSIGDAAFHGVDDSGIYAFTGGPHALLTVWGAPGFGHTRVHLGAEEARRLYRYGAPDLAAVFEAARYPRLQEAS